MQVIQDLLQGTLLIQLITSDTMIKAPKGLRAAAAAQAVNPGTWSEINGALKSRTERMFLHLQGFSQLLDATFPEPLLGN